MRPISPAARARQHAPAQRVAWLLTLASGGWIWRGATLPATLGTDDYPARLAGVPDWAESLPGGGIPGGLARARAEVRILDLPGIEDSLRDRLAVTPPLGLAATLQLAWLADDDSPLATEDAAVLLEGRVTAWRVEPLSVTLTLLDELQTLANRPIGRLLTRALLGADAPALGQPLPWLFGRLEDAELLPLRAGVVSRLAEPMAETDTTVPLVSLAGFPTFGRIQIGTETFDYTALDPAAGTLGSAVQPVWRPAPAVHPRGTAVRWVPPDGFEWLVSDHPCRAVESVRADGVTVAPGTWTAATRALGDRTVQVITMPSWPLNEDGREAVRITATVGGLADPADGSLVENPARVLQFLLTDSRLGALDPARLDAASFDAMATDLAAQGYRFARRLSGSETLGELLDSATREAGLWLLPSPPIRLVRVEPTPRPADAEADGLDASRFLPPLAPARISAPEGLIPPDAIELVGAPRTQGRGRPVFQFPPEATAPGALPRRFMARWLDLASPTSAGDLGELLWTHLADPPFEVEQEFPIGATLLAPGDTVRITSDPLDLTEALAWVAALETVAPSRVRLKLRGPWAGERCWSADPFNFIRRYAFGAHLMLVFGGVAVARLGRPGTLRLRGRLREGVTFAAGPFPGPVALAGSRLYLNVLSGGVYQPFLAFDAAGNADLAGTVCERSTRLSPPAGQALGTAEGQFWLSPDALGGALAYDAATRTLHLAGILRESVRL